MAQSKSILFLAIAVGLTLLLPLAAMQFTEQMNWTPFDFTLAGALLFGTGLAYLLVTRKAGDIIYKIAAGVAVASALLLIWVNLAVGIIGSEDNPANLMYLGVLAVLLVGAMIAQLQPRRMAGVLFATAAAQVVVTAIALITGKNLQVVQLVFLNGFFIVLWVGSGLLFQRANDAPD